MRIFVGSRFGQLLGLACQLKGHDVRFYVQERECRGIGQGIVPGTTVLGRLVLPSGVPVRDTLNALMFTRPDVVILDDPIFSRFAALCVEQVSVFMPPAGEVTGLKVLGWHTNGLHRLMACWEWDTIMPEGLGAKALVTMCLLRPLGGTKLEDFFVESHLAKLEGVYGPFMAGIEPGVPETFSLGTPSWRSIYASLDGCSLDHLLNGVATETAPWYAGVLVSLPPHPFRLPAPATFVTVKEAEKHVWPLDLALTPTGETVSVHGTGAFVTATGTSPRKALDRAARTAHNVQAEFKQFRTDGNLELQSLDGWL